MKICHVTTFWPTQHFGHTVYTDNLIRGMRRLRPDKHVVLGAAPAAAAVTDDYECIPTFRFDQDYVEDIATTARRVGADVAIMQYSPDLFGDDNRFPRLVKRLKELGVRPVINSHSIYPDGWRARYTPGRTAVAFDRAVAEHAALMTVHSRRMKRDLLARGIPETSIAVLPHGSKPMEERDQADSRSRLSIPPNAKVVLFFGFIWLGKGIDFLLEVFSRVSQQVPEAYLYVGGHTRRKLWSSYVSYLKLRARWLGISKRTQFWGDFVPEEVVPVMYSAADVVALPYRQDYSSVSGVVHQTAGIGKLMVCSRIAKFDEVEESVDPRLTVDPHDRDAWVEAIVKLLTDPVWAAEMRAKIRRFGEATSWENVGKLHFEAYDRLLEGK